MICFIFSILTRCHGLLCLLTYENKMTIFFQGFIHESVSFSFLSYWPIKCPQMRDLYLYHFSTPDKDIGSALKEGAVLGQKKK